jgi:HD superfamily phosphodiesterase
MTLLSKMLHFVLLATKKYEIDESHGLSHSMNVLHYANKLYESEVENYPILKNQEKLVYVSAVLHDMCDKKYMDFDEGINEIETFLQGEHILDPNEVNISKQIMATMSYSKVKKDGFPIMGCFQKAYNIVREADLLSAYDFDRCMIYKMNKNGGNVEDAFSDAVLLFENRVFKHNDDGLFFFEYSKRESLVLHNVALDRISSWNKILKIPLMR